jgi:REP element-mobilizing transposase RayT
MHIGEIFFWTATINSWRKLLWPDKFKEAVISSLEYLSTAELMDVFGFVIMPSHVHFIWRANCLNGKESPQGSFLKHTAHAFKKLLYKENREELMFYEVKAKNKKYEFWQRDPLAIHLYTRKVAFQKLNYIHRNPMAEYWQLTKKMSDYPYSSATFYECGDRRFSFLKDLREEF